MSDYISKDSLKNDIIANLPQGRIKAVYLELVDSQPTLDEKEIIRKHFERVIKRICDVRNNTPITEFKNGCNASLHQIHREIDIDVKECGINE